MPITQIIALAEAAAQAVPGILQMIHEAKAAVTGDDLARLQAAEASIMAANDAAHQRIQAAR